jgi:magnesium chelatase family protein
MTPRLLRLHCGLESGAQALLEAAMNQLQFSARAHDRIVKVARTIADLAGSERIAAEHVAEAVQYRTLDRRLWG